MLFETAGECCCWCVVEAGGDRGRLASDPRHGPRPAARPPARGRGAAGGPERLKQRRLSLSDEKRGEGRY